MNLLFPITLFLLIAYLITAGYNSFLKITSVKNTNNNKRPLMVMSWRQLRQLEKQAEIALKEEKRIEELNQIRKQYHKANQIKLYKILKNAEDSNRLTYRHIYEIKSILNIRTLRNKQTDIQNIYNYILKFSTQKDLEMLEQLIANLNLKTA